MPYWFEGSLARQHQIAVAGCDLNPSLAHLAEEPLLNRTGCEYSYSAALISGIWIEIPMTSKKTALCSLCDMEVAE
jgi:hypothetical protein